MKTRQIALLVGIAALAAAARSSPTEGTHITDASPADEASRPIAILVMAVGRSGSTMVGEFFRQSEDVLYFYEPCRQLSGTELVGLECLALLQRLTQCDFSLEDSAWIAESSKGAMKHGSPELRLLNVRSDTQQFVQAHEELVQICNRRRAVAVKSIRLYEGLGGDDFDVSGFKVLHLVRDPRGVVRSQNEHFKVTKWEGQTVADSTAKARAGGVSICGTYKIQLDSSMKIKEDRYLLIKYEDIATSPELAVELIYCWTGLGIVPPSVSEWVKVNTNMPSCNAGASRMRHLRANTKDNSFGYSYTATPGNPFPGSDGVKAVVRVDERALGFTGSRKGNMRKRTQRGRGGRRGVSSSAIVTNSTQSGSDCHENTKEATNDPYGTKRQSAVMVSLWRSLMPEEEAQAVWEACENSGVMDALGYDP